MATGELDFNVSDEEIRSASQCWTESVTTELNQIRSSQHPILPKSGDKNILITSALPYVNNVPHLGNLVGCCLSADIFAKYAFLFIYTARTIYSICYVILDN